MIAELIASNKSILFVCQKNTALEAVKKRLKAVGLDDFCLEIHGHKTNKKKIIEKLARNLSHIDNKDHNHDKELEQLSKVKAHLNLYVKELHSVFRNLNKTPHYAISEISKLKEIPDVEFLFRYIEDIDESTFTESIKSIEQYTDRVNVVGIPANNPLVGINIENISYSSSLDIKNSLSALRENINTFNNKLREVQDISGVKIINSNYEYDKYINILDTILTIPESAVKTFNKSDKELISKIEYINKLLESYNKFSKYVSEKYNFDILKEDIDELLENYEKYSESLVSCISFKFLFNQFLRCWLDLVFFERKTLKDFTSNEHEKLVEQFRELDQKQFQLAPIRIKYNLLKEIDPNWQGSTNSERGILLREARKQRAHMPVRKLLKHIPTLLPKLKPCLMMSPTTVAQFLELGLFKFDYVIFDEASQLTTEDAIGAILRGNNIVVTGDSKQMPPTSFFQSVDNQQDVSEDDDVYIKEDLGNILDECATSGMATCMLNWHYRSKHEHLIAFSNNHFYRNGLYTFPSRKINDEALGVKFNYLDFPGYSANSGENIKEAEVVVNAIFDFLKLNQKKVLVLQRLTKSKKI